MDVLGYLSGPNVIKRILKGGRGRSTRESEGNVSIRKDTERCNIAGFEDERGHKSRKTPAASRGWKSQGNRFPLELPEGNANTLI